METCPPLMLQASHTLPVHDLRLVTLSLRGSGSRDATEVDSESRLRQCSVWGTILEQSPNDDPKSSLFAP